MYCIQFVYFAAVLLVTTAAITEKKMGSGYGVDIYIIDTGVETTHSDFSGRAEWEMTFVDSYSPGTDLHGHGTHCAGTVMADTWGLAKKATAIAVRVLDEYGSGYVSGVVSGINWVVEQHYKKGRRSVANLSLGGGYSYSLNTAVDSAVSNGVHMVVAAGNEMTDACYRSPASAQYCITVAASDSDDDFAYFSNYGTCVDIIAPGVYITSTWLNNNVAILSVLERCCLLSTTPISTEDKIIGPKSSTSNRSLFKDCISDEMMSELIC
ncbi:LOW QUALITY PROTEIN: sexual differentiation process putative subtilase-type proteinase isp6-like [Gigantopelta aegis]|uniref:LOW QUALITY PROTEIN: sexual differentiation process putative subtilase-type proteinase isp6-like n=1 Tax=Gigantopelta aegis TaxID=1735272 RepID=UPI001B88CDDF|nr:LOW QUALITY PROTEIN: sexual differentiation process putative subtilase-type proteinase isp6-like [Gigantopelta aegis]